MLDGMEVVRELVAIVETYDLDAGVLAASIRGPRHMTEAALAGALPARRRQGDDVA